MDYNRLESDPLVITKTGKHLYAIRGVEDLPMTKRELNILLHKSLHIAAEEVAFMYLEFMENPEYTMAYFGMGGNLLYCK